MIEDGTYTREEIVTLFGPVNPELRFMPPSIVDPRDKKVYRLDGPDCHGMFEIKFWYDYREIVPTLRDPPGLNYLPES
jgi:hypothetical protein